MSITLSVPLTIAGHWQRSCRVWRRQDTSVPKRPRRKRGQRRLDVVGCDERSLLRERRSSCSKGGGVWVGMWCEAEMVAVKVWVCVDKIDVAEVEKIVDADGCDASDGISTLD